MGGADVAAWNFAHLALFGLAFASGAAAVVLLSGFLPLSARGPHQRGVAHGLLLVAAAAALVLLAVAAVRFAVLALPGVAAIIAGGLGLLAGPLLFQALPPAHRDRWPGLAAACLLCGGLGLWLLTLD
jgi:membrane-bound ClpP family serine protease